MGERGKADCLFLPVPRALVQPSGTRILKKMRRWFGTERTLERGTRRKVTRDFFTRRGSSPICNGFFLKQKGFLPKACKIFGSEMPLIFLVVRASKKFNQTVYVYIQA